MPKVGKDLDVTVIFRAPASDLQQFDLVAAATHRTRSDLLRLLLRQATMTGAADVRLAEPLVTRGPDDAAS
jgi:hypothetical protein